MSKLETITTREQCPEIEYHQSWVPEGIALFCLQANKLVSELPTKEVIAVAHSMARRHRSLPSIGLNNQI